MISWKLGPLLETSGTNTAYRLWGIDSNENSSSKFWVLTRGVPAFLDVYFRIKKEGRHAYEVIRSFDNVHAYFDLDMYVYDEVTAAVNHVQMKDMIGKCS
jgi:hypothetical protein